ncbi:MULTISPECIES: hypothetical protein [Saccharibacillus]|uniref:Secreted protein n=1 Tax=Saccharibacillus brassicae TaxID=2583377 RepID=A0A4Y6UX98_SACBS|nr:MULTISPECIES: hypothetical protein [Saccharibacillus]MWJ30177.1 hypothetical protein [Saccharibacillus sp. WB 17]QDH21148.1 hypothetical protein FFV09_09970 [Saccharibacillus brassicae]
MKKAIFASAFAAVAAVSIVAPASATTVNGTGGMTSVNMQNIQSMDIETALMMVQSERSRLLEQQLQAQLTAVQDRNAQIALLNSQLASAKQSGDAETAAARQAQIDAASNSQQMDMLRLQSMSNKRNEAFDVMTNFVKKMQDSRSSIIGNMR